MVDATSDANADVLVMTALGKELAAVVEHFGVGWEQRIDKSTGVEYLISTLANGLRVALTGPSNIGPVSAAIATTHAISAVRPKRVVLTGIAAGIAPQVQLGDVVVSDQVVDYDAGKLRSGTYAPRWRAYASDAALVKSARLFSPQRIHSKRIWKLYPGEKSPDPRIHVGTVLAGSKVVADGQTVAELRKTWTQAIGLEMEGGGGAAAAHEHPDHPTFIIVKGVCDRATARKNDEWQAYAAAVAAVYTLELLSRQRGDAVNDLREPPPPPGEKPWRSPDELAELGVSLSDLKTMLEDGFDTTELRELCLDLEIRWERLPNRNTDIGAILDIIDNCRRHGKLKQLLRRIKELRPNMFA